MRLPMPAQWRRSSLTIRTKLQPDDGSPNLAHTPKRVRQTTVGEPRSVKHNVGCHYQGLACQFAPDSAIALCYLSDALAKVGKLDEALAIAREATPLHAQRGSPLWVWLVSFAQIAFNQGRVSDAALAFGRAEAKYGSVSNDRRERDDLRALLTQSLSRTELRRLLVEGAALTDEEAAHIALAW
jgi:hypothetical protein